MAERVQKVMARAGLGSRRACEALILAGRVTVNGRIPELGATVDPSQDEIRLDGERLPKAESHTYVALNKPVGVVSTVRAQDDRATVRGLVPLPERLYPVGRLDVDSEGLVLLTNDGELANRLTHPKYGHEKEYRVLLNRLPDDAQLAAWRHGVVLDDGARGLPAAVTRERDAGEASAWIRVVMREGRKRQIRETARALGLRVRRLVRVRLGNLRLGELKPGEWRHLTPAEVRHLDEAQPMHPSVPRRPSAKRAARPPRKDTARSKEAGWQR
jgi:23S rRNA pseudouridine2605 synthase